MTGLDPVIAAGTYTRLAVEILLRERNPKPVTPCGAACCHWSAPLFYGDQMNYRGWLVWHWHALLHQGAREG